MYIHSYQIHNVLNVYRRQLSQSSGNGAVNPSAPTNDRVEFNRADHRQSLIDKVSAEIVDRMAQVGPQKRFEEALARQLERLPDRGETKTPSREGEFSYNTIDGNNRKTSNTLPVKRFSPLTGGNDTAAHEIAD